MEGFQSTGVTRQIQSPTQNKRLGLEDEGFVGRTLSRLYVP